MDEASIMRLATMGAAVIVIITAAILASSSVKSRPEQKWWVQLGGLVVSVLVLYAGYKMFGRRINYGGL